MKKVPFKKGIHPHYDGKDLAMNCKIDSFAESKIMIYPVIQHIGAPAQPIVKIGDKVKKGQKIAEASSFVSGSVYSSVSGVVKSIEERNIVGGRVSKSIVIENDFSDDCVDDFGIDRDCNNLSSEEILKIISDYGVVGMGGAGFPTGVKLSPKNVDAIDTLIINGAECEPYLTSDYRIMLEKTSSLLKGITVVLKVLKNANAIIAVEDNKPEAIKIIKENLSVYEDKIQIKTVKTRYPQGGERRLIASVTGRTINSRMLPADVGVVVLNTATVYAIYEAVCKNMPLIHRVVTVTGDGVNKCGNYDVPIGTPVDYMMKQCGGLKDNTIKIISGGPMMGFAMPNLDVPVTKTFSSVLAFTSDDVENMKTTPCIRCGRCVNACPENLVPQLMAQAVKANDYEKYENLGGMECIECGCCTYVCPAKRPLTQLFKLAKSEVKLLKSNK